MKISVRTGLPLCRAAALPSRAAAVRLMGTAAHVSSPGPSPPMTTTTMPPRFNVQVAQNTRLRVQPPSSPPRQPATQPTTTKPSPPKPGPTMPPGFKAEYGSLPTFHIPPRITGSPSDLLLAHQIISAFRRDGIIQIGMTPHQRQLWADAQAASRRFFAKSPEEKAACVDSQSYAGYIASGEEVTDGIADYSEIFTITRDFDLDDKKVRAGWPCHGRVPWPDVEMREVMGRYQGELGEEGGGWFPPRNATNGKGKEGRGIGSHTDYGLLVISAQDDVGGLFIRRPSQEEKFANWEKSAAGLKEDEDGWVFIPPVEGTHTVILGDMMQYLTRNYLTATPHKVGLNTRERFAFAYFHEPSFQAEEDEGVHYGTHFTNMFIRNYPERITTKRLIEEGRYKLLERPELRTIGAVPRVEASV
ncbi:hypothetical protein B0T21DRAFT_448086 [Apiosordaria backusii]|uniref:Fe2OG dioxygenase domain-containing protein n=1 Tax=Apiosordaria backusii TaxID=314023 RepID=A0AA40K3X5_9PEZI|nr:hypothetical protein B0T21DRAFT_448086 [Apiosordaria backusii]